jgi:hypothetical protein
MVMKDSSLFRPTHILVRGAYDAKGEVVGFGTPASILNYDTVSFGKNRLGLTKWLLDEKNPLTSRVFVNRMWQEFFGRGIVKTVGDFGMQGELPSHPELLDWVANDFRKNKWDVKRLVKQLVMSATYRQSANISKEKAGIDPENIYLSRMSRSRLAAEFTRDLTLSTCGLLNEEIGGPSVKPYQPKGIWEMATSGRGLSKYIQDHGDKLYRRGMYTFIKRTVPPPALLVFDGSSRDQCEVKRNRTNTPLQALVMLNDPTVLEASRVLAENLMGEQTSMDEKIVYAFRKIVCRMPKEKEKQLLKSYFENEKKLTASKSAELESFTKTGESKSKNIADQSSLAALMKVIMTIYNMEETIMKT